MDWKNLVLGVGIFILVVSVVTFGIDTFYPAPEYEDFCDFSNFDVPRPVGEKVECSESVEIDQAQDDCYEADGRPVFDYNAEGCIEAVECDFCNKEYEDVSNVHRRNIFFIVVVLGVGLVLVGAFVFKVDSVSAGVMAGGVGSIFYGVTQGWGALGKEIRFFTLLIILGLFIWIGYRLGNQKKSKSFFGRFRK
ncbi:MAG: hypothetical protein KKF56_04645 [Nanoarchaeota archaeon]|nr:hypothetical protein [Nanoarchaeota archaeon]